MNGQEMRAGLVRVDQIRVHPANVRKNLGDLRDLAESLVRFGMLQPVVVEQYGTGVLRLRAGHRRLGAAKLIKLRTIPAIIHRDALDDEEWLLQSLAENTRRRQLNREDCRNAIQALSKLGCGRTEIAEALGVSVSAVNGWAAVTGPVAGQTPPRKQKPIRRSLIRDMADRYRHIPACSELIAELDQLLVDTAGSTGGGSQ